MAELSAYETKARLSEVLRLVKSRREVIITERGKAIAKIAPFDADADDSLDQRVARLAASGQLTAAGEPPAAPLPRAQKAPGALQRFLADRDE